jgi:hypothetical protein
MKHGNQIAIEDAYWAARAVKTEAGGFATEAEVKKLIEDAGCVT